MYDIREQEGLKKHLCRVLNDLSHEVASVKFLLGAQIAPFARPTLLALAAIGPFQHLNRQASKSSQDSRAVILVASLPVISTLDLHLRTQQRCTFSCRGLPAQQPMMPVPEILSQLSSHEERH